MNKLPRTAADFRLLEKLVKSGYSRTGISKLFTSKKEWRSEVIALAGQFRCAYCNQCISLQECLACGQTLMKGQWYE